MILVNGKTVKIVGHSEIKKEINNEMLMVKESHVDKIEQFKTNFTDIQNLAGQLVSLVEQEKTIFDETFTLMAKAQAELQEAKKELLRLNEYVITLENDLRIAQFQGGDRE